MSAETNIKVSLPGALALLTLPSLDELTGRQGRGIVCVWEERHILTAGAAVDLGVREASREGEPVTWYPRACRPCTHAAAYAQLADHAVGDECPGDIDSCVKCRGFLRMLREYRR